MHRLYRSIQRVAPFTVPIVAAAQSKLFNTSCSTDNDKESRDAIILLSDESIQCIEDHLEKMGWKDYKVNEIATVSRKADSDLLYQLEPMMCERVAFRLKGVMKPLPDSNQITIFGRVSNFVGEIRDPDYAASLIATNQTEGALLRKDILDDLPSRAWKVQGDLSAIIEDVCVAIPSGGIRGSEYDSMKIQITPWPFHHQIVAEGRLCDSHHIGDKRNCTYDRSQIESVSKTIAEDNDSSGTIVIPHQSKTASQHPEDDESPCPLCRFLRKGSCRPEVVAWDACISTLDENSDFSKCHASTVNMLRCMVKDEYYDIMTTNSQKTLAGLASVQESNSDS